jgi:hypothetical protein
MDGLRSRFTFHISRLSSHLLRRTRWLFGTTPGLLLFVTAWDALLVALLSPFSASGPLARLDLPSRLGLVLDETGQVGRIVILYHALAVPLVAALVYLILDLLPVFESEKRSRRLIRPTITAGYMLTSVGGIGFAYLGWGWIAHGLFLVGLSLVFYAGVVLCVGLFPWRRGLADESFSLERLAFWLMALCTLISAAIGGATGAYFGNGFTAFLAEDVIRLEHDLGQRAIIAHLHIMLTLIDVALLLVIARTFGLRGRAHNVAMGLVVAGTTIASIATWGVMVIEGIAHKIINVGAFLLLAAAAIVAVQGFARLVEGRLSHEGSGRPSWGRRLKALLSDPVRFGLLFELIFVNVVVTAPGVYVAFNLETYRQPAFLEVERAIAVGHWHVLATLSAVIALFLVVDRLEVQGFLRRLVGWGGLVGSTLAFVFVQFYMFRQPEQEVGWALPFLDLGLALFLVMLAVFLSVQLVGMISREGNGR